MSILLKWFALVTMTIDHVGAVFGWSGLDLIPFVVSQPMRIIGRAAFPLYAWGLAAGWRRTRSPGRYFGNLAACAVFSQLPFTLALYGANLHPSGAVPFYFAFRPGYVLLGLGLSAAVGWLARSRAAAFWTFLAAALAGLHLKAGGFWLWAGEDLNVLYTLALAAACPRRPGQPHPARFRPRPSSNQPAFQNRPSAGGFPFGPNYIAPIF